MVKLSAQVIGAGRVIELFNREGDTILDWS